MKLVQLKISPEQVRKVRKMQPIKINKSHRCMTGEGVNLLVDETNYNALTKRFDTNRGLLFTLSASEVAANKDLDKVADEEVKEVMSGAGLFRHNKKAKQRVKHIVDALEGEMKPETTGKGLIKSVKKGIKKTSKKIVKKTKSAVKDVVKDVRDEAEDLAKEVRDEAKEELRKTISKVRNQAKKNIPPEMVETIDLVKKSVKAVKKFDAKKIDQIIKSIPKVYRDEIRDTYVGEALRTALIIGTDIAVQSAITAMAMNPYTAPLVPVLQASWELGGEEGTRMAIEKVGLGLGLGLYMKGDGLYASGKGLRVGAGLRMGAGNKVEIVKHKVDPFYMENKLTNRPTSAPKVVKQKAHEDKLIVGQGGGSAIKGLFLEKPVMSGILKPRPLKRVSIIQGQHQ